jgi:putative membrane protein
MVVLRKIIRPALVNPSVLGRAMFLVITYTTVVVLLNDRFPNIHLGETSQALQLSTIAIGLVFTFRLNTAYDRWWEGRKLWGQLVNDLRNLSIKFPRYLELAEDSKIRFARLCVAFAYTLKHHLRSDRFDMTLLNLEPPPPQAVHMPLYVTEQIYDILSSTAPRSNASHISQLLIDAHAKALMDICGACERIKSSPISGWFTASIWIFLSTYLLLLPWLVAPHLNYWTIVVMVFCSYFAIALELLAEEIQDPFGCDPGDLPLDQICHNIARSLEQTLGTALDPGVLDDHLD